MPVMMARVWNPSCFEVNVIDEHCESLPRQAFLLLFCKSVLYYINRFYAESENNLESCSCYRMQEEMNEYYALNRITLSSKQQAKELCGDFCACYDADEKIWFRAVVHEWFMVSLNLDLKDIFLIFMVKYMLCICRMIL